MKQLFSKLIASCSSVVLASMLVASCGGSSENTGTDSNTHWLEQCDSDDDCGSLKCLCGTCSMPCTATDVCAEFGASAICTEISGCAGAQPVLCAVGCSTDAECGFLGTSGVCRSGQCGVAPTMPMTGSCTPMDAASDGTLCPGIVGYTWNGSVCDTVLCGCAGADCGDLYPTMDACDRAHAACYAEHGILRDCTEHSDCRFENRRCCDPCGVAAMDDQIAINLASAPFIGSGLCIGDPELPCPPCVGSPNPALYPVCHEGQCRVMDIAAGADCTQSSDCRVRSKDCCECGGDVSQDGLMAVNSMFTTPPLTCQETCDACVPAYPPDIGTFCDSNGTCTLTFPR